MSLGVISCGKLCPCGVLKCGFGVFSRHPGTPMCTGLCAACGWPVANYGAGDRVTFRPCSVVVEVAVSDRTR